MSFVWPEGLRGLHGLVLLILAGSLTALVVWLNETDSALQNPRDPSMPFGFMAEQDGSIAVQDFGCNMVYFHGIADRVVARPYRLSDQETILRRAVPHLGSGMCHAYSPVALVLAQPLLAVSTKSAYLLFCAVASAGIVLLYRYGLLPRADCRLQVYLLALCPLSVCLITAFLVGQTSLFSTTLIGFFWLVLRRREMKGAALGSDAALAILFWALCFKPSLAYLPGTLLLGAGAWRPSILALALLGVTWLALAGYYGGMWTGLQDYASLLNHYNADGMTPFMRNVFARHGDTGLNAVLATLDPAHSSFYFALSRDLFLAASLGLVLLRVTRRITLSEQFQGMIWAFLLLCPYLVPAEDWILCLLVVEGNFFRARLDWKGLLKLLLFVAILNLRDGLNFPGQINTPLKCVLLAWMIGEAVSARRNKIYPQSAAATITAQYPQLAY